MTQPSLNTTNEFSDEDLVSLFITTHKEIYFAEIYRRYSGKIFGKCLTFFPNESEAQDLVHDIFIKILLNLKNYGGRSKFSTWVYSISYNYCIDQKRKKSKIPEDILDEKIVEYIQDPEDHLDFFEGFDISVIENILEELQELDKAVLMMKYLDDMSIKEICAVLQKTESAIKMRIKRAKDKFRLIYETNYKRAIL